MTRYSWKSALQDSCASLARSHESRRRALEAELLPRFRRQYPRRAMWLSLRRNWWIRPATAGLLILVTSLVACSLPTSYEVEMGTELFYKLEGADIPPQVIDEVADQVHDIMGVLKAQPSVSDAS